jgi:opacity protein-like surface antigen
MSATFGVAGRSSTAILLLQAALLLANGAQAEETGVRPEWSFTGMFHYLDDDSRRNTNNGWGAHFGLGTGFMNRHALEVAVQYTKLGGTSVNPKLVQWSGVVDYRFHVGTSRYFKPYALASVGYISNRFDGDDVDKPNGLVAALGVGVLTPMSPRFSVRTEIRYRVDNSNTDQNFNDVMLAAGLELKLTKRRPTVADADGDRVPDAQDRCEDTPYGAPVDQFGCATALDSDNDGVVNQQDMCEGTPAGQPVDRYGCRQVPQ